MPCSGVSRCCELPPRCAGIQDYPSTQVKCDELASGEEACTGSESIDFEVPITPIQIKIVSNVLRAARMLGEV